MRLMFYVRGFRGYSASLMLNAIRRDLKFRGVSLSTRLWAWKRGFLSSRVHTYHISEQNYRFHIPDFDYFKLHPINGRYSAWIDNKLIMRYLLAPFREFLPKYYFQISSDKLISKLTDCPDEVEASIEGIIQQLQSKGNLAFKPISGSLGRGFYWLKYCDGDYYQNNEKVNLNDIVQLIASLSYYLITEYVFSHEVIRKIFDVTPNTIKLQIVRDAGKEPHIMGSFIRYGTKKSGVIETVQAGTVFAGINSENGKVYGPRRIVNGKIIALCAHPDTGENLEIQMPNWDQVKMISMKIADYLPQLSYFALDIIVTKDSFKIIEINSLTSSTVLSFFFPFFQDPYVKDFFLTRFARKPRRFKRVLKMLAE